MLKALQDLYNQAMTVAQDIRKKYDGKPETMSPDEEATWTKAIEDADRLKGMILTAQKEESLKKWGDETDPNSMPVFGEPAKAAAKKPDAEYDQALKMFGDFASKSRPDFFKAYTAEDLKAYQIASDIEGGYMSLPMALSGRFLETLRDDVWMRQLGTVIPMPDAESLGTPGLGTDAEDADWTSELGTGTEEDTMRFNMRVLKPQPVAKRLKLSRTLVRRSPNAGEFILSRLRYKIAITEEKAFLNGTGVNQPLGVLTANADGISTDRDVATATANVVTGDDFWNTFGKLKGGYRGRASWIIHRNMETRIRKLKDSNNNYIWQPGGGFNGQFLVTGIPETICGRPYRTSEYMPDTNYTGNITTGIYSAILGDFSYYWIADSLAMELQVLDQLYAENNQIGYIFRKETDGMPTLEEAFVRQKVA